MKKLTLLSICLFIFAVTFLKAQTKPKTKPVLKPTDLEKYTYYFDIKDGKFTGNGADFLKKEIAKNQYFLLGEYHDSYRISEFTKALIPILHDEGYRYFGLEVGSIAVQVIDELSNDAEKTVENLNKFQTKYNYTPFKRTLPVFPFFQNVSDAEFLAEAKKRNWKLIGLDQEFSYSHEMLLDRMFANLSANDKQNLKEKHKQAIEFVKRSYVEGYLKRKKYLMMRDSKTVNDFLDSASKNYPENKVIANAFRKTNRIYGHGATREYFKQNSERIDYMKENLSKGLAKYKFDLKKDKMLLKMGGIHTAKGFGNLSLYEVGNTLHELAKFNENNSIHATFYSRFYTENSQEMDSLADEKSFTYRFKGLLQMAKKDQWTIIDLRPLRSNVFYSRKYKLDIVIENIFKQHDILIIPKTEIDTKRNFIQNQNNSNLNLKTAN